jgi:hypothetical protein
MSSQPAPPYLYHQCLHDIMRIVAARIRKDAHLEMRCFSHKQKHRGTHYHIRLFQVAHKNDDPYVDPFLLEPGIPHESLVPEKIGPIAYWIVKKLIQQRPQWMLNQGRMLELHVEELKTEQG